MNNKQTETKYKLTTAVALLLALYLGSAQSGMGYTLNFFPASTYDANTAAMDTALGVSGFTIEDFEDTTLIAGLSITYAGNVNATQSSLPQVLAFPGAWDGVNTVINDPTQSTPQSRFGYAILTTFTYGPGTGSMGIGLGGFQSLNPPADSYPVTDHRLHINGVALSQTLEDLAGASWTGSRLGRDVYLRVDADLNETITSIGFENIQPGSNNDDVLQFDHVAVGAVPEPSAGFFVTLSAFAFLLRRNRNQRSK